ncbi:hypothetical protein Tco_0646170 [Tanacetum coccineum]
MTMSIPSQDEPLTNRPVVSFMTITPRDFAKPVKAIALPQDVPSTSDHRLIKLENQVQCLMEAYLTPKQPTQVTKSLPHVKSAMVPITLSIAWKTPYKPLSTTHPHVQTKWEAHTQTFINPQGESVSIHSSSYHIKLQNALPDFNSHQEKRLSHLKTQLGQQQDDMIEKVNLLWKNVSEKLNDTSPPENAGYFMAPKSIAVINHDEKEELRNKGIKCSSKLLSPKSLSPASIKELNKNPSSPKRVHFINSIVILITDNDTEEEVTSTNACNLGLGGMVKGKEGVKEQGKEENKMGTDMEVDEVIKEEESEFETNEEVEEILKDEEDDEDGENFNVFLTMEELIHHEWLLKNPRPPWVKSRIRAEIPNNIKVSCMVGHIFKKHAYIDLESLINIMSKCQYNQIMTYELKSRQKPSNRRKAYLLEDKQIPSVGVFDEVYFAIWKHLVEIHSDLGSFREEIEQDYKTCTNMALNSLQWLETRHKYNVDTSQ